MFSHQYHLCSRHQYHLCSCRQYHLCSRHQYHLSSSHQHHLCSRHPLMRPEMVVETFGLLAVQPRAVAVKPGIFLLKHHVDN